MEGTRKSRKELCEAEVTLMELYSAEKYFNLPRYKAILVEAHEAYKIGDFKKTVHKLNQLPSEHKLIEELMTKLKGKSVHKTFERAGKALATDMQKLKALSSLLTHVIIECEHGNTEYRMLIPNLLEKLNGRVWEVMAEEGTDGNCS
jgi:hypothetical protein